MASKNLDITKTGPQSFRTLQDSNSLSPEIRPEIADFLKKSRQRSASFTQYNPYEHAERKVTSPLRESSTVWGESIFDDNAATEDQFNNLGDIRAENQPWYAKIGAGLAKGTILAGTTFLDGIVGLAVGIPTAIEEGKFSGIWDNEFSHAMKEVNELSEQLIPNYYSRQEQENPWYKNIFTANFWGDKFIKNLGFTVGALYSGGVMSAGLKATKLPQIIGALAKSSKAPSIITSGAGAVFSALNEGRIEALNNSTDWMEAQKANLDAQFQNRLVELESLKGTPEYNILLRREYENYNETLSKIAEDASKMGNLDLALNISILTASNIFQFGKMYANGFKTARKGTQIVGSSEGREIGVKEILQEASQKGINPEDALKAFSYNTGNNRAGAIFRGLGISLSEGSEELSQKAASIVSGLGYEQDVNNFYRAKYDPEASNQTIDWIKAFSEGISQTLGDGSSWEEFFIGSLIGALGAPRFRSMKSAEGKFQFPITIEGGIREAVKDYNEELSREQNIVEYLNGRLNSPEFKNYYQGLIRHNKLQNDMNIAAENDDSFNYKNSEFSQLVSDVMMFDNAGRIEDLVTLVEAAYDTSDANLESIVRNTTSSITNNDGKTSNVGPFVDSKGNPWYSTPEGKKEMIDRITQSRNEILETINSYRKIKDDIDVHTGQFLSDDQLEELSYLRLAMQNQDKRAVEMTEEIKPLISRTVYQVNQMAEFFNQQKVEEGKSHKDVTEAYNEADKTERNLRKSSAILSELMKMDAKNLAYVLASNPSLLTSVKKAINNPLSGLSEDEIMGLDRKLKDIVKLKNLNDLFSKKYKEYILSPEKLHSELTKVIQDIASEEYNSKKNDLKNTLSQVSTVQEFQNIISKNDNNTINEEVLSELESVGNPVAKSYREMSDYISSAEREIDNLNDSSEVKAFAKNLLNKRFNEAQNLQELANPKRVTLTFEEASDPSLLPQRGQSAAISAMYKVNGGERFKAAFTSEYYKPTASGAPNPEAPVAETTGDSNTPTIPPVTGNLPVIDDTPLGDISIDEVKSLNKEQVVEEPVDKTIKDYYIPAIPELHIEARKEGDFRTFKEVVAEKEKLDFGTIYDYLSRNNAFDYVNSGNLKPGDEVGFMIDPSFNDHTIFLIDRKNGQIIGSLFEAENKLAQYHGLSNLVNRIREEFNGTDKTKKFVATPTTRVSKIMAGSIPFGSEEKSLASILPNTSSEGELPTYSIKGAKGELVAPIFGVVKNGTISTNGTISSDEIISMANMSDKEGTLLLMIPNARVGSAQGYSPAVVRAKHFNREEFNPADASVKSTPFYRILDNILNKMATSESNDDVNNAIKELKGYLYLGGKTASFDIHIDFLSSPEIGNALRFIKTFRTPEGEEVYNVDAEGNRKRKEEKYEIFLTEGSGELIGVLGVEEEDNIDEERSVEDIKSEIVDVLLELNLPIQIDAGRLNRGGYNNMLIASNILTSNLQEAVVKSSFFTTDYFDNELNLHSASNPASVEKGKGVTPVGGKEGALPGIPISIGENSYSVDVKTGKIYDKNGKIVVPKDAELIIDLAWADSTYGNMRNSSTMIDNKILLPKDSSRSERVLDRTLKKYLSASEVKRFKEQLKGKKEINANVKKVIDQIAENQRRVDKSKTDTEYYYILEEDGQYHKYDRVHKALGTNWIESPKQTKTLEDISIRLQKYVDNIPAYNAYLKSLATGFRINLDGFESKTDIISRTTILNILRDFMSGTKSQRALEAGSSVDSVIRQFFNSNQSPERPSNMSEGAFADLMSELISIRSAMELKGERFFADNIVVYQKYPDGRRIAGEMDILSVDSSGNFKIYDIKTSKYSFYDFKDKHDNIVNYFRGKASKQVMSSEQYYTLQLSAYKNLFESQYHVPVKSLAIMPFVLEYDGNRISRVTKEKGIPLTYNESMTSIPPIGNISPIEASTQSLESVPLFNNGAAILNPVNHVLPEYEMKNAKTGYFFIGEDVINGYLVPIGNVAGIPIYMTKVPAYTEAKGTEAGIVRGERRLVGTDYYAVFPNGNTFLLIRKAKESQFNEQSAATTILTKLNGNPDKVKALSSEQNDLTRLTPVDKNTPTVEQERAEASNLFDILGSVDSSIDDIDDLDMEIPGGTTYQNITIPSTPTTNTFSEAENEYVQKELDTRAEFQDFSEVESILNPNTGFIYEVRVKDGAKDFEILKKSAASFEDLSESIKEALVEKGWTKEKFDEISEPERQKALLCLGL